MAKDPTRLTDEQWQKIEPHIPKFKRSRRGGRVPIDNRRVFEGILWVLRSGGEMEGPAPRVPLGQHLLAPPAGLGTAGRVGHDLAILSGRIGRKGPVGLGRDVRRRQLRPGEKGGAAVGATKRGKGTKWMVVVDGEGVPLGNHLDSASASEVNLLETTIQNISVPRRGRGRPRKKSSTDHRRQGLRLRWLAGSSGPSGHRPDLPLPEEQETLAAV